jgi:hypothetical protein
MVVSQMSLSQTATAVPPVQGAPALPPPRHVPILQVEDSQPGG